MTDQPPSPTPTKPSLLRFIAGTIFGIFAGLFVALLLIIAVELASAVVHPLPPDFAGTQEEMCAHVARYPAWVLALVIPAWAFTAFAGTWTANRIGARAAAIFVGLFLTASVLFNVSMLPYPIWFKIAIPLAVVAAVVAASRPCCGITPVL